MDGRRYLTRLPVDEWRDLDEYSQIGYVRVVCQGTGPGPRNCLCEVETGLKFVRPFRGMRRVNQGEQGSLFGGE